MNLKNKKCQSSSPSNDPVQCLYPPVCFSYPVSSIFSYARYVNVNTPVAGKVQTMDWITGMDYWTGIFWF